MTKDYTINDDIYCYPKTNVLKNKLNLIDSKSLEKAERYITKLRQIDLEKNPLTGHFDFEHLKKIHFKIFSDIYDFAGKPRKVGLKKGNSQFCYPEYIETEAKNIFNNLKENNYFMSLNNETFAESLSEFIGDLIALHPFREGNGRTIREFIRLLCLKNNYEINFAKTPIKERLDAEISAYNCKYEKLKKVLINELEKF